VVKVSVVVVTEAANVLCSSGQWQQQCEEEWLVDSLSGASFAFRVN
jgi:hypothetical protein